MIPFPFYSLEECQKNTSINSPMLLLSNTLLCFSLFDGFAADQVWTVITLGYPSFMSYGTQTPVSLLTKIAELDLRTGFTSFVLEVIACAKEGCDY